MIKLKSHFSIFLFLMFFAGTAISGPLSFDFNNASVLERISETKYKLSDGNEPLVKSSLTGENASNILCLKLSFSGGFLPGAHISKVSFKTGRSQHNSLYADVTVAKPMLLGFTFYVKEDLDNVSCTKLFSLKKGLNRLQGYIRIPPGSPVTSFDIFTLYPSYGDEVFIDNLRLEGWPPKNDMPMRFNNALYLGQNKFTSLPNYWPKLPPFEVLIWERKVKSLYDLVYLEYKKRPKHRYSISAEEYENEFKNLYEKIKSSTPSAILAKFRQGDTGFSPEDNTAIYTGWKDCFINATEPTPSFLYEAKEARGKEKALEIYTSRRSSIFEVDLSSIPKGAKILAARFFIVRSSGLSMKFPDNAFFVVQPCTKNWVENEVNGLQYANGKPWGEACGMNWDEKDPDFLPVVITHGWGESTTGAIGIDFTTAVRYWVTEDKPNHGFIFYSLEGHYSRMNVHSKEADNVKDRPCLMVIYEK